MSRHQLAIYSLTASALILAGLLAVRMGSFTPEANAELVLSKDSFTIMTARTAANDESLFVLNTQSGQLVVYGTELRGNGGEVSPIGYQDMSVIFRD